MSIDAGLLISRSLHQEIAARHGPRSFLLPNSTVENLDLQGDGCVLCWLPGPISLWLGIAFLPYDLSSSVTPGTPTRTVDLAVANMILVPHAAAVFATYVRWGALPLGICSGLHHFYDDWE